MPCRTRGEPAAKRGVLKRLRKVPQGEAMLGQLLLQARTAGAGLNARRARDRVNLKQTIESAQVKRNGAVAIGRHLRPNTPHNTGATTKRNRSDALSRAPLKHAFDLRIGAWIGDEVRRMLKAPAKAKHDLGIGLPQSVRGTRVDIIRAELRKSGRNRDAHFRESHIRKRQWIFHLEPLKPKMRGHAGGCGTQLLGPRLLVGKTPTPMLVHTLGHEFRVYAH